MGKTEYYATAAYGNGSGSSIAAEQGTQLRARAPYRIRHRGVFIGLISTIFVMCLAHLILGIYISVAVDPDAAYYDYATQTNYSQGELISQVALCFFWITIPAVLTGLSLFELIQISRRRLPSKWIAGSAFVACVLWCVQMTLEGVCVWDSGDAALSAEGLCPWSYSSSGWTDSDVLQTVWFTPWVILPVISMYIVYFSVGMRAVVIDKRDRKEQNAVFVAKADSLSLHTLSTSPVAETLGTSTIHPGTRAVSTRPPSYFSDGANSFDSYDVKKD